MASQPLAFAELLAGGVLIAAAISGESIANVFAGKAKGVKSFKTPKVTVAAASTGAGTTVAGPSGATVRLASGQSVHLSAGSPVPAGATVTSGTTVQVPGSPTTPASTAALLRSRGAGGRTDVQTLRNYLTQRSGGLSFSPVVSRTGRTGSYRFRIRAHPGRTAPQGRSFGRPGARGN